MIKIFNPVDYVIIPAIMSLFVFVLCNYPNTIYEKIGFILMIFACIFVLFTKYSFNEEYLEQSIFGKKRQLLLKDIDCIRTTVFWGSLIVMCKNPKYPKGGYYWMIDFTFQKKKRQLFFEYIKKVNPKCRLCF